MKIAVVYNRESKSVINLFGVPNREKYGKKAIKRISDALKKGGHQVATFEGDKQLISNLETFMPRVVKGELPGLVFNVSYGIQGQARYTHVPSILEMVGIPYVGSGPLAHSLALDKVVAKMIFRQNGLPTPDFAVLESRSFEMPSLDFPMIIKPKNEAVSFGLRIVHNEQELREGADVIFDRYDQPVLVEQYIAGREINVGLLGNNPPETLPSVELIFGGDGPKIYTYEDKVHRSDRTVTPQCPANISPELSDKVRDTAVKAFASLGCYDCARVDMRVDDDDNVYILEINSLASLGTGGSYVAAAKHIGLDYAALINRLVEVASSRYFGTPTPPIVKMVKIKNKKEAAFSFLTQRRDMIEKRLEKWCNLSSRTNDPIGIRLAIKEISQFAKELKLKPVDEFSDDRFVWAWETSKGFKGGTLLICHVDTPSSQGTHFQSFRRDPEYLYGEGIGSSRAPLTILEYALRALRMLKLLHSMHLGVLVYGDEGMDNQFSEKIIKAMAQKAARVFVLRPGNPDDSVINQRRGLACYQLNVEGQRVKLGQSKKSVQPLLWLSDKLSKLEQLSSRKNRLAVSVSDVVTDSYPMLLPHRVSAKILVNYYDLKTLSAAHNEIQNILKAKTNTMKLSMEKIFDRPPMKNRKVNAKLFKDLENVAGEWDIPISKISSLWPSAAGLVPSPIPVLCGLGPIAEDLYTPQENIQRISLIQRMLLLTQYLIKTAGL